MAEALASPFGIAIRSARPSALLAALHNALHEAGAGHSSLIARMGATVDEVWLAPRALLPDLAVVGSLGPSPAPILSDFTLD